MAFKLLPSGAGSGKFSAAVSDLLKRVFNRTTAMFTAISIVLCMCESVTGTYSMRPSLFWWFLLFSFVLAVISNITDWLKSKKVNFIAVMITHFVLSYIAFFFIFIRGELFNAYVFDAANTQSSPFFVGLIYSLAFLGAYIVIFGLKFAWYAIVDKFKK